MIQSIFIPEISTLGTHSTWTPGAQDTAGTRDTLSKPGPANISPHTWDGTEQGCLKYIRMIYFHIFYLVYSLHGLRYCAVCTEKSEETTSFFNLFIFWENIQSIWRWVGWKNIKNAFNMQKNESGKKSSLLEYYWRPPFIGNHLSLETLFHWRPPFIGDLLSLKTTFHWRPPFIEDHLSLETSFHWRPPFIGDLLSLETP